MSFLEKYLKSGKKDARAVAFLASLDALKGSSPKVADLIVKEIKAQRSSLKLIASENYTSLNVQLAMGNLFTDKYSEGSPYHRFYAGCENVDEIESLANEELKKLFNAEHAYVQPHSGADANLIAYFAILMKRCQSKAIEALGKKSVMELSADEHETIRKELMGQTLLGMSLNSGGHLTHGYRHNISSKLMRAVAYDVDPKTHLIDYDQVMEVAKREKPLILVAGYSAYPRLIDFAKMKEIADAVGATFMVDMAHFAGLVAGGVMTGNYNPVPFADVITSTTHKTLRGPRGGLILCKSEYQEVIDKGCPLVIGGPLPHVMAAKAVAFEEANQPSFKTYAENIVKNAKALAERFVEKGVHVWSGGTDNHLLVVDVMKSFGLTGKQAENALRESGMTLNRNPLPFDENGPWYTSGIRLGTAALTTLGMGEGEMREIADLIIELLKGSKRGSKKGGEESKAKVVIEDGLSQKVQERITDLLKNFPLYEELGDPF